MAILLGCDSVGLEFPTKHIFDSVTLGVNEGDRIGIVGKNGDGKSTLLSVLAGAIEPDDGRVTHRRDVTVGILGQRDALDDSATVHRAVVGDAPEYEWAASPRVRQVLDGLIADVPWEGMVGELSGGQRRRVDLARLLIGDFDVLMLDEPTNHLDMRTISWLAAHLKERWNASAGALLVVTHDRWFLDEVCTSMWEVHDGRVDPFEGGYSAYILQRVERDRMAAVTEERRRNMARKELAWLSRGAQARSTKPKFRVEAARELIADVPPVRDELELKRLAVSRLGKQVIDVVDVDAGYAGEGEAASRPVLSDVTWLIGAGDRYGLLGENGAGKSTLLKVIQGKIDGKETSPEKLCERLGFTTQQMWSRICDLSGGQRRRLSLLLTILSEPNVLILDEPGNDLDTDMLAIVEDLLDGWPGTLILVTHDRYLMERVTDQQWAIIDGTFRHVPGGVDQYLQLVARNEAGKAARPQAPGFDAPSPSDPSAAEKREPGMSNAERQKLKKEVASLERKMETRRSKIEQLEQGMFDIDPTDFAALSGQQDAIAAAREELDELEMAWLEASERLEG